MSVPYLGLTRVAGESGKHKANGAKICLEAGEERASRSRTLDRTLSKDNVFEGYSSGQELWDELCERAESYSYTSEVRLKSGKTVTRTTRNRENAIVGFAVIFKPPAEVIREWDRATREKFFEDCYAVAEELEPELFQPSNILMRARHNDEKLHGGDEHEHAIGVPLTSDGRYNGGKMLNHMKNNFNKNFARHMRERGWDMEDLDLYDPSRKHDEEYMAERRERRRKQGRPVNDYAADQAEERAAKAAEIEAEAHANTAMAFFEQKAAEAERIAEEERRDNAKAEANAIKASAEVEARRIEAVARERADEIEYEAQRSARQTRRQARMDADKTVDDAERDADSIRDEADRYDRQVRADADRYVKSAVGSWKSTMDQAVMYRNMMTDTAEKMWKAEREAASTGGVAQVVRRVADAIERHVPKLSKVCTWMREHVDTICDWVTEDVDRDFEKTVRESEPRSHGIDDADMNAKAKTYDYVRQSMASMRRDDDDYEMP